jgi:hypothetical protein
VKRKLLGVLLIVALTLALGLVPAVHASESVIFDDQFDDSTLGPDWVISPGKGWYSLTDNPGYLRYIIDAYGWGSGAIPLQLIRPFSGDQWVLTTAITYNMRPAAPTNCRNMRFFIRVPGATGATMIYTCRTVGVNDANPGSNAMCLYAGSNVQNIYFPNSPNPLPLERWYFEIERNKDHVAVRASNDGNDSTFEYQCEYTFPSGVLGNAQEIVIQATGWYGSNNPPGYADFDFIKAIAIEPDSLTPSEDYNPVGTEHEVTATVTPAVADVEVWFEVTGANTASGSELTNATGLATFTYTGTNAGEDTIRAYFDTDGSGHWDDGEPTTNTVTKYWLEPFVTGGGIITEGRGKTAAKITFGGNVGFDENGDEVGQWNINFHNVNNPDIAKGHFHSTEITDIGFFDIVACPEPDPPDADYNYAHFVATGRFNGVDGWEVRFNMTDYGEGNKTEPDGIRVRLWDASHVLVYDSSATGTPPGDFPNEGGCALANRTRLDGGNIQIHPPAIP